MHFIAYLLRVDIGVHASTLPHCPGWGPTFHRGAPQCPSVAGMTMKSVGVTLSQPEMQTSVGIKISALKSDWGALQPGWVQIFYVPLGVRNTIFLELFCGAPRCTPAGAVR